MFYFKGMEGVMQIGTMAIFISKREMNAETRDAEEEGRESRAISFLLCVSGLRVQILFMFPPTTVPHSGHRSGVARRS